MKPSAEHQKLVDEEAKRRSKLIELAVKQILDVLVTNDMSVNDFEVVINECNMRMTAVYRGKKVKELM